MLIIETRPIVLRQRLLGGLTLKVMEGPDGRGRAMWCRRDGWVVRWTTPPLV